MPPFLYEPLKSTYRCHDYYKAEDKPGTLESVGKRIRGLVQGGGTVTPTALLDSLPALEIISVFGVGYDGVPVTYCKGRRIKVTNTPDVLTDDVADVALGLITEHEGFDRGWYAGPIGWLGADDQLGAIRLLWLLTLVELSFRESGRS